MRGFKENGVPPSSRTAGRLLIAALLVLAVSCGGSGSQTPAAPQSGPVLDLVTSYGTFTVYTNGHPINPDKVADAVARGYRKARSQIGASADSMRFDGYSLVVMPSSWGLNGRHVRDRREIRMREGVELVVAHELQHFFAWELGRNQDCRVLQDHPQGYDLHCNRLP
jgi:hypothetical protein